MSTIKTGFLAGPNGRLHLSVFMPERLSCPPAWVIHVPAFAEEMNKCRPMVSRQARRLAEAGLTVVVPDLYGTGDSEGEFCTASWDAWKSDLKCLVAWSQTQGADKVTLWGMRLGCLLAADAVQDEGELVSSLLFWQPVHSGRQHMTQFLRLRMAAALMQGDSENVAQLRHRLLQGENIEVAGYRLSSPLFTQIERVAMADLKLPSHLNIQILEVVGDATKNLLPVSSKQLEKWQNSGLDCAAATVQGEPFWMTQEIAFAPALVEATAGSLACLGFSAVGERPKSKDSGVLLSLNAQIQTDQSALESLVFSCRTDELVGLLHRPKAASRVGVLVVVGGPQYRIGSHRQFVQLARFLCDRGFPVLRFDYRGMGDSSGKLLGFEGVNEDIRCAIDIFQRESSKVTDIVIWGLCDAATAAVFYAHSDARVKGLVLVNPWVYSTRGAARAYLKHYYLERFFSKSFWQKILRGEFNPVASATSVVQMIGKALAREPESAASAGPEMSSSSPDRESEDLVSRFTHCLEQFPGEALVILSGNDLTAAEFIDVADSNRKLRKLMRESNIRRKIIRDADHTFSKREWSSEIGRLTAAMIEEF